MNPLTNVRNTQELNKRELELGLIGKKSWHDKYKDSAWVFIGGLPYDLTEGDVICVFSQYGEVVNVNLVRDKQSGKFKGFGFLCYEDQRSTVLAVDNLNGFNLLNRTIRVDHVEGYRPPKEHGNEDEVTQKLRSEGCAPRIEEEEEKESEEEDLILPVKKEKKEKHKKSKKKKEKKKKKKKEKDTKSDSSDSDEESTDENKGNVQVKKEKVDRGYDRALNNSSGERDSRTDKQRIDNRYGDKDRKYDDERRDKQFTNGRKRKTEERTSDRDRDNYGKGRYGEREGDGYDRDSGRDRYERDRGRERYDREEERDRYDRDRGRERDDHRRYRNR
ncbi:RNA-binding motif protein, X-linked 2-like [Argopecten irradians]|uniref:RNA-binding motif protein, X-linked 2-like n=1 Tax=Argopecten irradians TaxID=31199 RepID=UPI0037212F72